MSPGDSNNLILTGFMGTGKTAVGQAVARRLERPFVDMDVEIEARAGKPVSRIFAEEGEGAFRHMEAVLCRDLSQQRGLIVATGGGALVDPSNRARMMASGVVVCLNGTVDEILRRVSRDGNPARPLLVGHNPRAEIERLLAARREAYAAIPWQIDTTALSVEQVAAQVIELADVITLPVRFPGGQYPIHVGEGLLVHVGGALRAAGAPQGGRVAVVSNPVVAPLYGAQVTKGLRAAGLHPFVCTIPDGEQHKTLTTLSGLYEQFLAGGLDRSGTVLSLGGGVTGDVAGLAAATFMRGLRFTQVPTTLLAMADASVGGKTGVDLPQGKNLVGAFHQPVAVVIDLSVLATLPQQEFRSGMAEVIKQATIDAPDLFAELETPKFSTWLSPYQIARALRVKIAIVEQDPFETGQRAVLNLGHTVGHALEKLSDFELRHGEAVSVGLVAATRIGVELGRADPSLVERIEATLAAWGLPLRCPSFEAEAVWTATAHDKKRRGRGLRWVLPQAIGQVDIVEDVPQQVVLDVLRSLGAS